MSWMTFGAAVILSLGAHADDGATPVEETPKVWPVDAASLNQTFEVEMRLARWAWPESIQEVFASDLDDSISRPALTETPVAADAIRASIRLLQSPTERVVHFDWDDLEASQYAWREGDGWIEVVDLGSGMRATLAGDRTSYGEANWSLSALQAVHPKWADRALKSIELADGQRLVSYGVSESHQNNVLFDDRGYPLAIEICIDGRPMARTYYMGEQWCEGVRVPKRILRLREYPDSDGQEKTCADVIEIEAIRTTAVLPTSTLDLSRVGWIADERHGDVAWDVPNSSRPLTFDKIIAQAEETAARRK